MRRLNFQNFITAAKQLTLALLCCTASISHAAESELLDALKSEAAETTVEKTKIVQPSPANNTTSNTPKKKKGSYLDGLSAEAESTKVDDSSAISTQDLKTTTNETKKEEHWNIDAQNLGTMRPGLNLIQFEDILKDNYFASYIFYKKLDPTSKTLVYKNYQGNPDIEHIRSKIISLSR